MSGIQNEGGTFGTVAASNGNIPSNSRYVNDAATTLNLGLGYGRDNWTAEIFVNNVTSEEGYVVQTAGKFTPESSMMRPRTMGLPFRILILRRIALLIKGRSHDRPFFCEGIW
jgi:outer membrane receptor protein involved in Fe transport